jgi:hypothetical protein
MKLIKGISLILLSFSTGCVGGNTVGAYTTDNLGVNVQSTPEPVAEISFARREGTIQPAYENGNVPAIAASVQHEVGGLFGFATNSKSVFAGGNAAVFAAGGSDSGNGLAAVGCIPHKPTNTRIYSGDQVSTLFFATDTTIGFKVSFPGGPSASPPNASLGYKRNEMALAPMFGEEQGCSKEAMKASATQAFAAADRDLKEKQSVLDKLVDEKSKDVNAVAQAQAAVRAAQADRDVALASVNTAPATAYYAVHVPSFIAVASSGQSTGTSFLGNNGKFDVGQVFATGKAAELISRARDVKGSIANVATSAAQTGLEQVEMFALGGKFQNTGSITLSLAATGGPDTTSVSYDIEKNQTSLEDLTSRLASIINDSPAMQSAQIRASSQNNVIFLRSPAGIVVKWQMAITPSSSTVKFVGPMP